MSLFKNVKDLNPISVFFNLIKYYFIFWVGVILGAAVTSLIVIGFAIMILNRIGNLYYALVFFLVGSHNVGKLLKKNRSIQNSENVTDSNKNQHFKRPSLFIDGTLVYQDS